MTDNQAVWDSILGKVKGHHLASLHLPQSCVTCGNILTPMDLGVDPYTNERMWVTSCCNKFEQYIEVIAPGKLK